jgi:ParB/RepB/Spo0J family partition protein
MKHTDSTDVKHTVIKFPVSELKSHPRQDEIFDDLPSAEFAILIESLRHNGQDQPIHVLPDGTILAGHQRVRAAKTLAWSEIDAIVRRDLVEQGENALIAFFLRDNLERRQLGPCGIARCYRLQRELPHTQRCRQRNSDRQDLRDRLATRFEVSGRQLDRYARLLKLPRILQTAIDQDRLPAAMAERLLRLPKAKNDEAAKAVERGDDPKAAVQHLLPRRKPTAKNRPALPDVIGQVETALDDFATNGAKAASLDSHVVNSLRRIRDRLTALLRQI